MIASERLLEVAAEADVTYRATVGPDNRRAELHLRLDPASATAADAYARFVALHGAADPMSLEIEIRHGA